jgi:hypothetical protein
MYTVKTIEKPSDKQQGKKDRQPRAHATSSGLQTTSSLQAADDVTTQMNWPQTISSCGYCWEGHEPIANRTQANNITWRKAGLHVVILLLRVTTGHSVMCPGFRIRWSCVLDTSFTIKITITLKWRLPDDATWLVRRHSRFIFWFLAKLVSSALTSAPFASDLTSALVSSDRLSSIVGRTSRHLLEGLRFPC